MKTPLLARCQQNKPLNQFSTLGIGGPARYFLEVHSVEELRAIIGECHQEQIPYILLGKGSNTLFDDRGFAGLVILNKILGLKQEGNDVHVGAGYSFSLLGVQMARHGLSGLEFASGIPGSVGGAVYMNAGANQFETSHCLTSVTYITEEGKVEYLPSEELLFSYRFSSFHKKKGAIAAATFRLKPCGQARKRQFEMVAYRKRTQPYGDLSVGCIFRNPLEHSAGALIERCGLKGVKIGGAEVSSLHANFIVNRGGATAADVLALAAQVKNQVFAITGITLEMEIRYQAYES